MSAVSGPLFIQQAVLQATCSLTRLVSFSVADLTNATGVAQHRVNQSLLALVGAKAVLKSVSKVSAHIGCVKLASSELRLICFLYG